ncbi:MAG: OsmC family protein [Gemmatimonadota bacterium]
MSVATQQHPNGVNVEQLVQTVEAIQAQPELAQFQFRARSRWITGGKSETRIRGFYGAGGEDSSRPESFVLVGDEPPVLLGTNEGPNAVEVVLHALTSCLTVGLVYNAAARGITVHAIAFEVVGALDLRGFLGLSDMVRPGFEEIQLRVHLETDASEEALAELWTHVLRTSPLLDILRNPVPVTIGLAA